MLNDREIQGLIILDLWDVGGGIFEFIALPKPLPPPPPHPSTPPPKKDPIRGFDPPAEPDA